ncbi:MAG: nucleotidyltransferase family protein [Spirochaetes bacterium]|nr:nucleotidyltransferase family protein [Spirochaetota bacterium]
MNRDQVLDVLRRDAKGLMSSFNLEHLSVFGSAARDELRPESDIDILVEFKGLPTLAAYCALQDRLTGLLGRRVDLVTEKGLKPRVRPHVEKDLIRVA